MKELYKVLTLLIVVTMLVMLSGVYGVAAHPKLDSYEDVIHKSLSHSNVGEFLAVNQCSQAGQFYLCQSEGVALWVNKDNIVDKVYLYRGGDHEFKNYHNSELPSEFTFTDTMGTVEQKLGQPKVVFAPQAGWQPGKPDVAGVVGYTHYWATYKGLGITVIYDTNSASDKSAKIHAVIVDQ